MTRPMTEKLEPCPFCGADAHIVYDGPTAQQAATARSWGQDVDAGYYRAQCKGCGTSVGEFRKKAECAPAWNRRSTSSAVRGMREAIPFDKTDLAQLQQVREELRNRWRASAWQLLCRTIDDLEARSEYFGVRLKRDDNARVILAGGAVAAKAGDRVRFLNKNGHDWERADAVKAFGADAILTVERISVGRSSSRYYFVGVPSYWNTVMFERVPEEAGGPNEVEEQGIGVIADEPPPHR